MLNLHLIWRYAFSKTNRHRSAVFVILFGIAVGMFALIVIISLMNHLQSELMDQLKNIESFHLQISLPNSKLDEQQIKEKLATIKGVDSVYRYVDNQVLIQNRQTGKNVSSRLRLIDSKIWEEENPFSKHVTLNNKAIPTKNSVALASLLARKIGATIGDELMITMLVAGRTATLAPMNTKSIISDYFVTQLFEFDDSTVIGDLNNYGQYFDNSRLKYGIFLNSHYQKKTHLIQKLLEKEFDEITVVSWQQANSAFYSALMIERILLYLFLLFMFFILTINIKSASSRLLFVKQRELAILRAMGCPKNNSKFIFIGQAFLITVLGEIIGILGALFLKNKITSLFAFFNKIQFFFTKHDNILLTYPFKMETHFIEISLISLIVLCLSLLFTYLGCKRLLVKEPMEMLYHE